MRIIKKFFHKDVAKPTPDPVPESISKPEQAKSSKRLSSLNPFREQTKRDLPTKSIPKTKIRPEFSNDDCVQLKAVQNACELAYGKRLSVAEMFFTMLNRHVSEDYPEIVPYMEQFNKIRNKSNEKH